MDYLYRYRSLEKLFAYKELENLEIYFSKPSELNDQMEDYMNIVWQGDEIAFCGLFKHYLYTLTNLYYDASLRKRNEKIDIEHLPIFLSAKVLDAPEMETTFKSIYYEFFSSDAIANIPVKMANSGKKFSIDEMITIFKTIHCYAYLVIDTQIKRDMWNKDLLKEKEHYEIYNSVKYLQSYTFMIDALISDKFDTAQILRMINMQERQQQEIKNYLNVMHSDKDNYNISVLTFDFPELYVNQLKRLLYSNFYVTCFSETYRNEPMWSHYADCENGICLCYKVKNKDGKGFLSLQNVSQHAATNDVSQISENYQDYVLNKVCYSDDYPEIDFFRTLGCLPHPIITGFWLCNYDKTKFSTCLDEYKNIEQWRLNYHQKAKECIYTKAKNWEYEKEYRIFQRSITYSLQDEKEKRFAKYRFKDLDAIIFGRKVSQNDKQKIVEIITRHCKENCIGQFKFYDIYYSAITKRLELKPYMCYCNNVSTSKLTNRDFFRKLVPNDKK